jgi:hypothetical protein
MPYPEAFLEIQVTFARRMAALTSVPLGEVLLRNIALYRILGLDWSLGARASWRGQSPCH